jgi:hypothetical protein
MTLRTTNIRYFGTAEIAEVMGVSPQAVSNRLKRGKIPPPTVRLRMGPVWSTNDPAFGKWLGERIELSGRRA